MRSRKTLGSVLLAMVALLGMLAAGPAGAESGKPAPSSVAATLVVDEPCPDYNQIPNLTCYETLDGWARLYIDSNWNVFGQAYGVNGQWVWMDRSYDYGQTWEGWLMASQYTGEELARFATAGWLYDGVGIRVRACTQTLFDSVVRCTDWH
jgi:hypothetical protein